MPEKNTPRDFFLHVGAFVALYLAAISLIVLLFDVINFNYPDPLYGNVGDPYSGSIRFSIASLVVLVPISLYLFYLIQRATRLDAERKSLGVRKWLTYITLFITGVTIVGDFIVLLNSFLGGSYPTPFVLKTLVIFGVMGAGFAYFFLDVKSYWVKNAIYSKYVGIAAIIVVLASIVGGGSLIGSPSQQRALRIDSQEVQDLSQIQYAALAYWQNNQELPKELSDLENSLGAQIPQAPENQPAYEYAVTGPLSFKVCATFLDKSLPQEYSYVQDASFPNGSQWDHEAGHTCFERTIDPKLFPPADKTGGPGVPTVKPLTVPVAG